MILNRAIEFFRWAEPWRERYGTVTGLRIALDLRRAIWSAPANSQVAIQVPGIPRPIRLRAGTSDSAVFDQVFYHRQADFPVSGDPTVIVDAGANIGLTAIVFATRYPLATILALEIDQENFSLLSDNAQGYPNIRPVHNGLWSKRARIQVTNPHAASWAFQTSEVEGDSRSSIGALGVQDILSDFHCSKIDVLKIDIEGGEYEVFRDGVDAWIGRIGMIAVEVHDRVRPGCTDVIRRALAPHGFEESRWAEYLLYRRSCS